MLIGCVCVDIWSALVFAISGCGCCCKRSSLREYGEFFVWTTDMGDMDKADAEGRKPPYYRALNGTEQQAFAAGSSSKSSGQRHHYGLH